MSKASSKVSNEGKEQFQVPFHVPVETAIRMPSFPILARCLGLAALFLFAGCGGGSSIGSPSPTPGNNPSPTVASLSPASAPLGAGSQTLTINGSGFTAASVASVNGSARVTTFITSQQLSLTLTATDLATPTDLNIAVTNPPPGGGTSAAARFAVIGASLQVNISSLPAGVLANVMVTGPNGLSTHLGSSQTVVGGSGLYTVNSAGVAAGTNTFYPTVAQQSVSISIGATSTISVDYHTIIPNTTKVLDAQGSQGLILSPAGNSITLPATSPVAQTLAPGDVLVSGPSSAAPQGLLVKIISLSASGATITAAVQGAVLEDLIQQGTISFSSSPASVQVPVVAAGGKPSNAPARAAAVNPLADSCAANPQKFVVPFDLPTSLIDESGTVEFCPSFTFTFDFSGGKLQSLQTTINAGLHSDLTVTATPSGTVALSHDFPSLFLAPVTVFLEIPPLPPIPIVLSLQLTPFVNLNGGLTASFSTALSTDASASVGFSYLGGVVSPVHTLTVNFAPGQTSLDAQFALKGQLGVKFDLLVYGVSIMSVPVDDFLEFKSAPTDNPWWVLNAGFEGPANIDLHIFGHTLGSISLPDVFGETIEVAHAPGSFVPGDVSPAITAVSPNQTQSGAGDLTIAVSGNNFVGTDVVQFSGTAVPTKLVDSQNLAAVVPAAALNAPGTFALTVTDTAVPSLASNSTSFTVVGTGTNPVPVISSLSPQSFVAGAGQQTLTINGSNFVGTSAVIVNSASRAATLVGSTQLTVLLTAQDLAVPATFTVVVSNPAPGGGPSNPSTFTVSNSLGTINSLAGNGTPGYSGDGGPALNAQLSGPSGVAFDAAGNMYVAEEANHVVRKVDVHTGTVTTIAGLGGFAGFAGDGGPAASSRLFAPRDVAIDSAGNLFIADSWNVRVRKIDAQTGFISTVAGDGVAGFSGDGGPATAAHLGFPTGVKVDAAGNLYIADSENNRLRKIDHSGVITTIAGTGTAGFTGDGGPATAAALSFPVQPALDGAGNIYFADYQNFRVRRIDALTGVITTVAGNGTSFFPADGGPATSSAISGPQSLIIDPSGALLVADVGNDRVRAVNVTNAPLAVAGVTIQPGNIDSIAGTGVEGYTGDGGPARSARIFNPCGFALDPAGNFVFADYYNAAIRRVFLH